MAFTCPKASISCRRPFCLMSKLRSTKSHSSCKSPATCTKPSRRPAVSCSSSSFAAFSASAAALAFVFVSISDKRAFSEAAASLTNSSYAACARFSAWSAEASAALASSTICSMRPMTGEAPSFCLYGWNLTGGSWPAFCTKLPLLYTRRSRSIALFTSSWMVRWSVTSSWNSLFSSARASPAFFTSTCMLAIALWASSIPATSFSMVSLSSPMRSRMSSKV
mmetsp:Transcript_75713/g.219898  ORF Transcript_75713/g.219898 Transcript_75713/m.219898 type:complete len:222 (+) Transcript_75713:170-835(+)